MSRTMGIFLGCVSLGACSNAGTSNPSPPDLAQAEPPTATATVTSMQIGTLSIQIGTNQLYAIDTTTGAPDRLATLAPKLVRIHIQPIVGNMPAGITKGDWTFDALDLLVADVKKVGSEPLMNIAVAPSWQWTVTNATSMPKPTATVTDANDMARPFGMFADYMARLVSYYNTGKMVDETGKTITNPLGKANRITYWELWNEPAITSPANPYQPPGPYPGTATLTPDRYAAMWQTTTAAMLAVDPSIKLVGPALPFARTQFYGTDGSNDYIPTLLRQSRKPDVISYHSYATPDYVATDAMLYTGGMLKGSTSGFTNAPGLSSILDDFKQVNTWVGSSGIPIWIDETNINGTAQIDPMQRAQTQVGVAWSASEFAALALQGNLSGLFNFSFDLKSLPNLSLLDVSKGQPYLLYWLYQTLPRYFPSGSTLLSASASGAGLVTLAARPPGSQSVRVLLVNHTIANPATDVNAAGVAQSVAISVSAASSFTAVTQRYLDDTTDVVNGPALTTLPTGPSATVSFAGQGVALLDFSAGDPPP